LTLQVFSLFRVPVFFFFPTTCFFIPSFGYLFCLSPPVNRHLPMLLLSLLRFLPAAFFFSPTPPFPRSAIEAFLDTTLLTSFLMLWPSGQFPPPCSSKLFSAPLFVFLIPGEVAPVTHPPIFPSKLTSCLFFFFFFLLPFLGVFYIFFAEILSFLFPVVSFEGTFTFFFLMVNFSPPNAFLPLSRLCTFFLRCFFFLSVFCCP